MDQKESHLNIKKYGLRHTKPAPSKGKPEEEEIPIIIVTLVRNPNTGRLPSTQEGRGQALTSTSFIALLIIYIGRFWIIVVIGLRASG